MELAEAKISFMGTYLLELAGTVGLLSLYFLVIIFTLILLYIIGSITSYLVFYIKESIQKTDRAPVGGGVFHMLFYFDTLFDYMTNIARKHKTFRMIETGHCDMYTADPANIEHILKLNFYKYTKGKYNYDIIKDLLGDGIFAVDGEKWRHQRKLASYEFSTRVLKNFSSNIFRTNATRLANMISGSASTASVMDMQDLFMKSTLDSIFKVGFGVELDTLSGSDELGARFSKAFDDANRIVFWRYADIFWKARRYLNIGMEAQLKRNIKVIDDYVFQLIDQKREQMKSGMTDKQDILSRFIATSKDDPEHMTDQYLRDIILNFLIAGKDTSANTLTWFFYMLCKHPVVQEKIVCEVREVIGADGGSSNIGEFASGLTEQVLDQMQFLHAALTETLRLYPAVPLDGKFTYEDDVLPDGFKVKKGDGVTYMSYTMGRMTYLWGEDAEDFKPERWLEKGIFRPESPFKFIAFHAGPRMCLGKEFAYKQMKILAVVLLRFFKFKLEDESKAATYRTMFTLHMDGGLHLIASQRHVVFDNIILQWSNMASEYNRITKKILVSTEFQRLP